MSIFLPNKAKYHNKRIVTMDGQAFDSKREYRRWAELVLLERAGQIEDLQRQVKFELIPAQYSNDDPPKLLERACDYIADFVYTEYGKRVVEDAKGARTSVYLIKRKLMLHRYGIQIRET